VIERTDAWLEISGLRSHANVWDGGGSTTVLLLHGYLDLGRSWTWLAEALGDRDLHLVAPDWRGHGQSEWIGAGGYYHFADYARDLEQIAAAVRRERLVVVGHSMGGGAAVMWCGARPAQADALVLVDWPGAMSVAAGDYPRRMAAFLDHTAPYDRARFVRPLRDLDHAVARLRRVSPRLSATQAERYAGWATTADERGLRWRYDPLHRTRAPVPLPAEIVAAFFAAIQCPTLYIGGACSPLRDGRLTALLDTREDVARVLLTDAGHMVQVDQPEALAREVLAFVNGLGRP